MKYFKRKRTAIGRGLGVHREEDCFFSLDVSKKLKTGRRQYISVSFMEKVKDRCFANVDYVYLGVTDRVVNFYGTNDPKEDWKLSRHEWKNRTVYNLRVPIEDEDREELFKFSGYYNMEFDPKVGLWYIDLNRKVR